MRLLDLILFPHRPVASDASYHEAMGASDDLIQKMRESSKSSDAARTVIGHIWAKHHNIPFLTSVFEAVEEMNLPNANGVQRPHPRKQRNGP